MCTWVRVCACVTMCVSSMSSCLFLFACHKLQVTWQAADAAPAVVEMLMLTCLFPWAHETNEREHTHTRTHILTHTGRKSYPHTKLAAEIWKQKPETEPKLELNWTELKRTEALGRCGVCAMNALHSPHSRDSLGPPWLVSRFVCITDKNS